MNRRYLTISSIVLVLALGLGIIAYNQGVMAGEPKLTEEEAKAIAEDHMNGTAKSIDLEQEGRHLIYEVTVENADGLWEVEVDANNGEVLEVEEDDGNEKDDD